MSYRVLAQAVRSRDWLNWNVPLSGPPKVTYTLSGPGEITGVLAPEMPRINLQAYGEQPVFLHLEQDGHIRATGIVEPASLDEASVEIVATGVSAYPHEVAYLGEYSQIQVDPLQVVRDLWAYVQSYPDGDMDVTVDHTQSTVRIGKHGEDTLTEAAQTVLGHLNDGGTLFEDFTYPGAPSIVTETNSDLASNYYREHPEFKTDTVKAWLEEVTSGTGQMTTDGPYELMWWDHKNVGSEIDSLAKETPFDYREEASWNSDHTDVNHHIRLGHPRLGRRLDTVSFTEGVNVSNPVPLSRMEDLYASHVVVLGSGEGRDMIRGSDSERGARMRRVVVLTDKDITSQERADKLARDELSRRRAHVSMEQVTVDTSHPSSRWGHFNCGDEVPVTGEFPWVGRMTKWHRITQIVWEPDSDSADVKLVPSESVRYGPPLGV